MGLFSRLRSENLKMYLRGVKILEENQSARHRPLLYIVLGYFASVELYRTYRQEEWERASWVPGFVLYSRREHYLNYEYVRLRNGQTACFTCSNWDPEAKMMYHVDRKGNHAFEKIVLPHYHYGNLNDPAQIERFSKLALYNLNKNKRYDLDNYLRHKTVTLGDWLCAIYFNFNRWCRSFDPFFYRLQYFYDKERAMLALNLQRDDKPNLIVDLVKKWELNK
mmetsp:Transcript_7848/g.15072  ORF Transcript_7848/g.15072 Transcript_7848/m.15072 type:complete len:222 (+) Transcript_7848:5377-6042(+)